MTRVLPTVLALAVGLGCASPTPIRYVASERPDVVHASAGESRAEVDTATTGAWRMGFLWRSPTDVPALVRQLEEEGGVAVLTQVNLRLQTPFCYTFPCIGWDRVEASSSMSREGR